jgi:hypothetical protein
MLRAIVAVALASLATGCTGIRGPIEDPGAGPRVAVFELLDGGRTYGEARVTASDVADEPLDGGVRAVLRAQLTLENDSDEELLLRPQQVAITFVETKGGRLLGAALPEPARAVRTDADGLLRVDLELRLPPSLEASEVLGFGLRFAFERAGDELAREIAFTFPAARFGTLAGAGPTFVAPPTAIYGAPTLEGGHSYQPPAIGVVPPSPVYAPTLPPPVPPSPHLPAIPSLGGPGPTFERVPAQPTVRGRN